jgi:hypothetical protein
LNVQGLYFNAITGAYGEHRVLQPAPAVGVDPVQDLPQNLDVPLTEGAVTLVARHRGRRSVVDGTRDRVENDVEQQEEHDPAVALHLLAVRT